MKTNISFSNLKHTDHACNAIAYGTATVASYAIKSLGDKINVDLFQFPQDFSGYLDRAIPQIACFSNYIWNLNISYEFAKRIKRESPESIIVFGGPNYPLDIKQQETFLLSHPEIDFYISREGERAFIELFTRLLGYEFSVVRIKRDKLKIPNCHYISDGEIVQGPLLPPIANINEIPSPYLTGLLDAFLSKDLTPLMETTKGCPFQCTYCENGNNHFKQVRRFSLDRIKKELEYIARRTTVPTLLVADLNFGMYKEDLEVCREIAAIQKRYGWPKYFDSINGKNKKERILEAISIVPGSLVVASVQTTDEQVLKNIKRQNVSLEDMVQIAKEGEIYGCNSFSELILCLPGDTKEAHFKSIAQLIDAEMNVVRSHQFIMLPGAESSSQKTREQYGMKTRFRVIPKTVSPYRLFGTTFFAPEIDEICIANNTMSFEDYLECRAFNLTVEIFYNNSILQELLRFLRLHHISIFSFIKNIHTHVCSMQSPLAGVYKGFLLETNELWKTYDEAEDFLRQPGVIDRYRAGELGNNEQLMYRAIAFFNYMDDLHKIAFDIAQEILIQKGCFNEQKHNYLGELAEFSLLRKKAILSIETRLKRVFHYDFISLLAHEFRDNPVSFYKPEGINMVFSHTGEQKKLISQYLKIYGSSSYGLGNILSAASNISNFFRKVVLG